MPFQNIAILAIRYILTNHFYSKCILNVLRNHFSYPFVPMCSIGRSSSCAVGLGDCLSVGVGVAVEVGVVGAGVFLLSPHAASADMLTNNKRPSMTKLTL